MTEKTDDTDPAEVLGEIGERSLSEEERAELFHAVWSGSADQEEDEPVSLATERRERRPGLVGGIVLVATAALALLVFWPRPVPEKFEESGIKSASQSGSVELRAFVGHRDGDGPSVGPELGDSEEIAPNASVLFRFRVDRRARLVLYAEEADSVERLWSVDVEPGEGEVASNGEALAMPARSYADGATVALVAYFGGAPPGPPPELTAEALGGACSRCAWDIFEFGGAR